MTRRRATNNFGFVFAGGIGFLAGVLVTGVVMSDVRSARSASRNVARDDCGDAALTRDPSAERDASAGRLPAGSAEPIGVTRPPPPSATALPVFSADPIADLRRRDLLIPVRDVDASELYDSFSDKRGANRLHEAIDILSPRGTPVVAVESGQIARLHFSEAGGITVYQHDPTEAYAYYYAHLDRYAPGLRDGATITKGQVLGYVGTSGNAPEDTPHLHFAIFRLTNKKQWWQGTPIDPYTILRN
jgi:murein DD-endopeptidase MepM/ murein hydrolase activator NlpD